ncbi:MAG: TonB-dependent receptor [Balneolaceae bacterium]|nr:TonB-dependent receptor [Balneolaceae bacterium]MCH8549512.1 TonB-dependent receptor [Balneolaceae bacterium]
MTLRSLILFLTITGLLTLPALLTAHSSEEGRGSIEGIVVDAATGNTMPGVTVLLYDHDRGTSTDAEGRFSFSNVPAGIQDIRIQRVGYLTKETSVLVTADEVSSITLEMTETVFRSDEIRITGRRSANGNMTTDIERVVSGSSLRRQLGRTIAETLDDEPGLAQRSMGPAPARPVLRGLGGDRLLILEDGGRTGDLSATASDHALAIEPMTAEHIELIRGPSALIHGSNTLGGVINVVRGQIPTDNPEHRSWSVSTQAESVNTGLSGGLTGHGNLAGDFAYRFDGSVRNTNDLGTPVGSLDNTGMRTYNGSLGVSYIRPWGMVGVSGNIMDMNYGVPGGDGITDAHPNGVDIEMYRRYLEVKSYIHSDTDFINRFDIQGTYAYYTHRELEKPSTPTDRDIVGSEFGVLTSNLRLNMHHSSYGFVDKGVIGLWGEHRDYASGGFTHTPETNEYAIAGYIFQETTLNRVNIQGALRYDYRLVAPQQERQSIFIGQIRNRSFSGVSASLMGSYPLTDHLKIGSTVMRSFRTPGVEELYAEGPHLANYSYEIGNPDLNSERGWGSEIFLRSRHSSSVFNMAIFRNQFSNYVFPRETGQPSLKREDLPEFQFQGKQVLMVGAEMNYEVELLRNIVQRGTMSYVRADFIDDDRSIPFIANTDGPFVPMIPPFNARFDLDYRRSDYNFGVSTRMATSQNRTDEFEEYTDGYFVVDLNGQYQYYGSNVLHTLSLSVENIFNTEYRNHLSRIKSIMPEAGRNVKLLYRVYF